MGWLLLLGIHMVLCALVFLGIYGKILKVNPYMFFVALCVPGWGILLVLILHFQIGMRRDGKKEIGVAKLEVESELYQSIVVDDKKNANRTIPMEEALIVNSSQVRRSLILDVLHDNPKEYVEFLQKAGNNDDTEVVHYAVTAMVEIFKENDDTLHALEREYRAHPGDFQILQEYTDFLWHCLSGHMMQGQVEQINRELFASLMKEKRTFATCKEDEEKVILNELERKNYTEALEGLQRMQKNYPDEEETYLLWIQYYASLQRGEDLRRILNQMKEREIYLSAKGKEALAFWGT